MKNLKCKMCKKDFLGRKTRKYCSLACAYKDKRRVENAKQSCRNGKELKCPQCGKVFWLPMSKITRTKSDELFCSQKCFRLSRQVKLTCKLCRKTFYKRKCEVRIHPCNFCSRECSLKVLQTYRTPETCLKASVTRRKNGSYSAKTQYSRCKRGWYKHNGKKYFMRSSWELNYACYLDFLVKQKEIKEWDYEVDTFWFKKIMRGVRSYLPDFKVFNNDGSFEYHEVKGWMDAKSKTKLKRMAKYYPEVKMVLIDKEPYTAIMKYKKMYGANY